MSKKPTVIITGANGFVGSELTRLLVKKGWHVRALVQHAHQCTPQKNVKYIEYDMGAPLADETFSGADFLVHLAYVKEDRKHPNAYRINIQGTRRLLAKSRQHKLTRNIFMSSMSAHEHAVSSYGKQKFKLEKLFNTKHDTVIRSGLVIGDGGLIKQITSFMRTKHVAPLIDGGDQPLQIIAIYDLVTIIERLLQKNLHGIFTVGTPEVYTYREFYQTIRRKLHIKAWIVPVPFFIPLYMIRLINFLHLPLHVTEDNLWGLKKLTSFETLDDLKRIGVQLDVLEDILDKPGLLK